MPQINNLELATLTLTRLCNPRPGRKANEEWMGTFWLWFGSVEMCLSAPTQGRDKSPPPAPGAPIVSLRPPLLGNIILGCVAFIYAACV